MNIPADFFSRNPNGKFETVESGETDLLIPSLGKVLSKKKESESNSSIVSINNLNIEFDLKKAIRDVDTVQRHDETIRWIITKRESGENVKPYLIHRNVRCNTENL